MAKTTTFFMSISKCFGFSTSPHPWCVDAVSMRLFGRSDLETWRGINGLGRRGHDHASDRRRQLSDRCKTQSRCTDRGRRETYEAADRIADGRHPGRRQRRLMMSPAAGW